MSLTQPSPSTANIWLTKGEQLVEETLEAQWNDKMVQVLQKQQGTIDP